MDNIFQDLLLTNSFEVIGSETQQGTLLAEDKTILIFEDGKRIEIDE